MKFRLSPRERETTACTTLSVAGQTYHVEIVRSSTRPVHCPRLAIVAFQPNEAASGVLEVCLRTIKHFTPEPHELWVVDNNSPAKYSAWLREWPELNVIFNHSEPTPEGVAAAQGQMAHGSYANAVGLELATRAIEAKSQFLMTLHMDTMPCRTGWLSFLLSKMGGRTKAAGVRMDRARTADGVLHVLGYIVDFRVFQSMGLDFLPQLPEYDVGDRVTVELRRAGYEVFACRNTLWEPQLADAIRSDPFRKLHVDRSFDDEGNVIFLHLGRGVRRTTGLHTVGVDGREWIRFAENHLLLRDCDSHASLHRRVLQRLRQ